MLLVSMSECTSKREELLHDDVSLFATPSPSPNIAIMSQCHHVVLPTDGINDLKIVFLEEINSLRCFIILCVVMSQSTIFTFSLSVQLSIGSD